MDDNVPKVYVVGTNGLPANYGGFETLTHNLCTELNADFRFTVFCSRDNKNRNIKIYIGANLIHVPLRANGWQSIPYDSICLLIALIKADIVLMLGSSGGLIMPIMAMFNKKVILNVGGLDWKRSKWNFITKKIIKILEKLSIQYATTIVADNKHIKNVYAQEYGVNSEIIAYGGNHTKVRKKNVELVNLYSFLKDNYYVSVSRAQEDNNIHLLLEAFKTLKNSKLVVISNWNSSEYGRSLFANYSNKYSSIILVEAIYDQNILDVIRSNASLYIHTHSACGSAPSLIEAMSLGLPVICYDCEANRYSTDNKTMYFSDSDELCKLIEMKTDEKTLKQLANSLNKIAEDRYTWSKVSQSYSKLFTNN